MIPELAPFELMASSATIVVGAVTYPGCRVIYFGPGERAPDLAMTSMAAGVTDGKPMIAIRKDQVEALPVGSTITGTGTTRAERNGLPARMYRVDYSEDGDDDFHHAWCS